MVMLFCKSMVYHWELDMVSTLREVFSDGVEKLQRIIWWKTWILYVSVLEDIVSVQRCVIEIMDVLWVCCSFQEAANQHCLSFQFDMVQPKTPIGGWSIEDHFFWFL